MLALFIHRSMSCSCESQPGYTCTAQSTLSHCDEFKLAKKKGKLICDHIDIKNKNVLRRVSTVGLIFICIQWDIEVRNTT